MLAKLLDDSCTCCKQFRTMTLGTMLLAAIKDGAITPTMPPATIEVQPSDKSRDVSPVEFLSSWNNHDMRRYCFQAGISTMIPKCYTSHGNHNSHLESECDRIFKNEVAAFIVALPTVPSFALAHFKEMEESRNRKRGPDNR